jgi:hypothetical protein
VADAMARVPDLIASFQPKAADGTDSPDAGLPQILVNTGLTRRFSSPSRSVPARDAPPADFDRAVLAPLTPSPLGAIFDVSRTDK